MRVLLCVAGTDPSSAAGLTADVQVARDYGLHAAVVVTSVVAQNTTGVRSAQPIDASMVEAQLDAVWDDFDVAAVKVGLVATGPQAKIIAQRLGDTSVWDPVLHSGDGQTSLYEGTLEELRDAAFCATVITPNVPEAAALSGQKIASRDDASRAARTIAAHGPAVLLKIGHLPTAPDGLMRDIWAEQAGGSLQLEPLEAVADDVRGTGCHLASALACELACGASPHDAAEGARRYLNERLRCSAAALGRGRRIIVHG